MRVAPHEPAGKASGVRVEQELVGIEAVALLRRIGTMDAIAVQLPRRNVVQVSVPDILAALRKFDAFQFAAALGRRAARSCIAGTALQTQQ